MSHRFLTGFLFAIATTVVVPQSAHSTEPGRRRATTFRPITQPRLDPDARKVKLFDGMDEGEFATKVIATGPQGGKLLITNTTEKPLTVELPTAFVAVPVLKKIQPGGNGPGGGNNLFGGQPSQQPQGGQQAVGGGAPQPNGPGGNQNLFGNGNGNGNGNPGGGGPGFFSIPPEATVAVSYVSACLNHGKPDPSPRANYKLMKVDEYTKDPVLQELIALVGTGTLDHKAAQAAVWNRTDHMTWQELAAKFSYSVIGKVRYFQSSELKLAKEVSSRAVRLAGHRERNSLTDTVVTVVERR
ncbi:MAG: hypothetical protein P8J37_08055 [Fuerstiella sp.]|nr:hypothetical protein [Fuerstiella sp.]